MPKAPDQIDALIMEDIQKQDSYLTQIGREQRFHQEKKASLMKCLECHHEVAQFDAEFDRCKHCGYKWVR